MNEHNYCLNSDMWRCQRFPNSTAVTNAGMTLDKYRMMLIDTNLNVTETAGQFAHEGIITTPKGSNSYRMSITGAVANANFFRVDNRVVGEDLRNVRSSLMGFSMAIRRDPILSNPLMLDTRVRLNLQLPSALNTWANIIDPSAFQDSLSPSRINADGSLTQFSNLTLGDISDTEFQTFFGVFDIRGLDPTLGFAPSISLERDEGDPFLADNYLYHTDWYFRQGGRKHLFWQPTNFNKAAEKFALNEYYQKSFREDLIPGNGSAVGQFKFDGGMENIGFLSWDGAPSSKGHTIRVQRMRTTPSVGRLGDVNGHWTYGAIASFGTLNTRTPSAAISLTAITDDSFRVINNVAAQAIVGVQGHWELTADP